MSTVIIKHYAKTNGAVKAFSHTLKNLQVAPIETIGDLLLEVNEKAQLATIELHKAALEAVPQSEKDVKLELKEYLKKADIFVAEAIKFSKVANDLKTNQDRI